MLVVKPQDLDSDAVKISDREEYKTKDATAGDLG